jgi:hypothetical protein
MNVTRRLAQFGHTNPHWAPQSSFCGGTVGSMWPSYTHHVPFHNLTGILDVFAGRVPAKTYAAMQRRLVTPTKDSHVTNAAQFIREEETPMLRQMLFDFYEQDYRLFLSRYLYDLPRSSWSR